jgi:PAS domain S-box-containing protein
LPGPIDFHHLFWTDVQLAKSGSYFVTDATFGPAFWVHGLYSYILILLGTVLLIRSFYRSPELYRGQMYWLLAGTFAPWIGNMLYLSGLSPFPDVDLTPLAFSITGLAMGWSLYRYRLFDIAPVARDLVLEGMSDAMILVDAQGRTVDVNPAAVQLLGRTAGSELIGKRLGEVVPQYEGVIARFRDVPEARTEIAIEAAGAGKRYFELRISPLRTRSQELFGRLIVLHEVTQSKQAEEQIRAQNEALVRANRELGLAREQAEEANRLKVSSWRPFRMNSARRSTRSSDMRTCC